MSRIEYSLSKEDTQGNVVSTSTEKRKITSGTPVTEVKLDPTPRMIRDMNIKVREIILMHPTVEVVGQHKKVKRAFCVMHAVRDTSG